MNFTFDKRIHYVVSANALLSVPYSNDKIVLQSLDLFETLDESSTDYFFITSVPVRSFEPGKTYKYVIKVASKRAGAQFELSSGPKGMRVSSLGQLTWHVPKGFDKEAVEVIVAVSSSTKQTCHETFTIHRRKKQ